VAGAPSVVFNSGSQRTASIFGRQSLSGQYALE